MSSETCPAQYHHKTVPVQVFWANNNEGIPRDTLGNPMPPPVPAGFVSRLQPAEWGEYWLLSPNGNAQVPSQSQMECQERQEHFDFAPPEALHLHLCEAPVQ